MATRRILLKLSGEALAGEKKTGFDEETVRKVALQVKELTDDGVQVGIVIGGHVTAGKITRSALVRVVRDGIIVADDKVASLRRFKDDVKEVADGYDCGITLEKFSDIKQGDILEAYEMEEYRD